MKFSFSRQRHLAFVTLTLTGLVLSLFAWLPIKSGQADQAAKPEQLLTTDPALEATARAQVQKNFGKLPLSFVANHGQTDAAVKFTSRGQGAMFFLTANETVMKLRQVKQEKAKGKTAIRNSQSAIVKMRFEGANSEPNVTGADLLPGKSNYFIGNDHSHWQRDVANFARVHYDEIYPGIDAVFYGNQRQLEYDFVVAPGADPRQIKLSFAGAESLKLDAAGNLVLKTAVGEVVQQAPVIYQQSGDTRQPVSGGYVLTAGNQVAFEIGDYDASRELVIDPIVAFASYLGGGDFDDVNDVTADAAGNVYVAGKTESEDFPANGNLGSNGLLNGDTAAFITKLSPDGTSQLYSTLIDGRKFDSAIGLKVDAQGNAYATGTTGSSNFPLEAPFQDRVNPGIATQPPFVVPDVLTAAFVLKLNAAGNALVFSTYLSGNNDDEGFDIAVSNNLRVYVTGYTFSTNFPVKNEFQNNTLLSGKDAFIAVFAADGQSLVYSSYLRGTKQGNLVAVDGAGNAYITGIADSANLTTRGTNGQPPFRASRPGGDDAFVAKFNPFASGNSSLVYSTYLGGSGTDKGLGIAVDSSNQAYVTGITGSVNFPLQAATGSTILDSTNVVNEAFVTCLNANGSGLIFSTFLGGSGEEEGFDIALDSTRNIYVGGRSNSTNFPLVNPVQATRAGGFDVFAARISPGGKALTFSSYLGGSSNDFVGGIAVDSLGSIYLGGETTSTNFPTTLGALQTTAQGGGDGFVAKIKFKNSDTIGTFNDVTQVFSLRNSLTSGPADIIANIQQNIGADKDFPIAGDWDGDGVDTIGVFNSGTFGLSNSNDFVAQPDLLFNFGQLGDVPVAGDWDGDGIDTIGVFRAGTFLLRNSNSAGAPDITFNFGLAGGLPVAGDWNGDRIDTVGVFIINNGVGSFVLRNAFLLIGPAIVISFGQTGDVPVTGDWDGNGVDTIGLFRKGMFFIRQFNNNDATAPNQITVGFGVAGEKPVAGDWNGLP